MCFRSPLKGKQPAGTQNNIYTKHRLWLSSFYSSPHSFHNVDTYLKCNQRDLSQRTSSPKFSADILTGHLSGWGWNGHLWVSKSPSGVVEVRCVAAVVVVGNQHFSVLVGPEAVEVNQDAGDGVALATVHQVLESDLIGVFRLHHVKDLILKRNGGPKCLPFVFTSK